MTYFLCGKRYKLKRTRSLDSSDPCECGGKFRYVQSFDAHFNDELDPINEFNIYLDCGNILDEMKFCKECGYKPKSKINQDTKREY